MGLKNQLYKEHKFSLIELGQLHRPQESEGQKY